MQSKEGGTVIAEDVDTVIAQLRTMDCNAPDRQFEVAIALPKLANSVSRSRIVDVLIEAVSASQALVRAHAAESLGLLEERSAFPVLVTALQDHYQLVRSYAARALGKIGDKAAIEPLVNTLAHDAFFGARAEAAEALRKLCPNDEGVPCKQAREALKEYREEELKRQDERSRRVLAEIDLSLQEIDSILSDILEYLRQRRGEEAIARANEGREKVREIQDNRDRMGGILVTRANLSRL
jgi:hypothetical protein